MANRERSLGLTLKSVNDAARSVRAIASTDAIDSYGEIVEQDWDLKRYNANPVVLFAHNSRELPVGTASDVGVVGGRLECTITFGTTTRASEVWQSVRDGSLRALSVGFNPRKVRSEKRNGVDVYILSDNELFEISVVPVPANPEAVMRAKGAVADVGDDLEAAIQRKLAGDDDDVASDLRSVVAPLRSASADEIVAARRAYESASADFEASVQRKLAAQPRPEEPRERAPQPMGAWGELVSA